MKLTLRRLHLFDECTIGVLSINDQALCYTLEDRVRELPDVPVEAWKVPGSTAIPRGSYRVLLDWSERFKRILPRLLDVPGYTGVRIHAGNTAANTEGCILVGLGWPGDLEIRQSQAALTHLLLRLREEQEIELEIT